MSNPTVFYSWQSDLPRRSTRDIVRDAAAIAVAGLAREMSVEDSPRLDHDTLGEAGTPAITETIYRKIKKSAIFVADVTVVGETASRDGRSPKRLSNPNVLIELGYAAAILGWDRTVLVMNKHYGSPESLPFDLRYRRFPVTYELGPESSRRDVVVQSLSAEVQDNLRTCLAAEYDRVDTVLSRLTTFARSLIIEQGNNSHFWETKPDDRISSRFDLAILQLLELEVVECTQAATDSGVAYAYTWTYLGRQCALRLGVQPPAPQLPNAIPSANHVTVDLSSYESISKESSGYHIDVNTEHIPPPHKSVGQPAKLNDSAPD